MLRTTKTFQGTAGTVGLVIASLLVPGIALAYVGPGAGISMLGALWGLVVGVVMAVGVILFWPIRMMIRKAKANKAEAAAGDSQAESPSTEPAAQEDKSASA
jgi:type VI protein secretion system component VasK